jgi:uncharacterized protein
VRKHGVRFEDATLVFADPYASDDLDDSVDYGEERWIKLGMSNSKLLVVVYTERNGRFRLISARRGARLDYDNYYRSP